MKSAFPYYGGKAIHLKWLLPLLSAFADERVYVEPFCGSCAVAINRKHKAKRIIVNDANSEVVNFFMVLREQPALLSRLLYFTPKSKAEWNCAYDYQLDTATMPNAEAARQFAVKVYQSFNAVTTYSSRGWRARETFGKARTATYQQIAEMIKPFDFEYGDAVKLIAQYNRDDVFIYADPPYLFNVRQDERGYKTELENEAEYHTRLLDIAVQSNAHFAISGYHSPLYDEALADWHCYERETYAYSALHTKGGDASPRTECLWVNYPPSTNAQAELI